MNITNKTIIVFSVGLVAACQNSGLQNTYGHNKPAVDINKPVSLPVSMLANYKDLKSSMIPGGRGIQSVSAIPSESRADFSKRMNSYASGECTESPATITTIGDLKKQGLFTEIAYADENRVAFIAASGKFVKRDLVGNTTVEKHYSKLVVIYDPNSGLPMGQGLVE